MSEYTRATRHEIIMQTHLIRAKEDILEYIEQYQSLDPLLFGSMLEMRLAIVWNAAQQDMLEQCKEEMLPI